MKRLSIVFLVLFATGFFPYSGLERQAGCQEQAVQMPAATPQQAQGYQQLTPAQQQAIQSEVSRSGGVLTPEAINSLKTRPEFKGLTPEQVAAGKEKLRSLEKSAEAKEGLPGQEPGVVSEKREIGGEPKKKSLFDRARQVGNYQEISLDLKPFGYEFFQEAAVRILTERKDVPVPLKYVVGPGDEVRIALWGRVNASYNLKVDRDGKIMIPEIGPMAVAGMTFEDMSGFLVKQAEQMTGTNVDVSMGALKTIPIFILGDVRRPGSYTIGSLATITDALLVAGGPSEIGSMRKIELRRKDRLVTSFDLYDLFLKGDKSKDMTLQAGDVIFVPVTGPLCGIAGNVRRPAVYEFKDRFDLAHLFDLAGGIIPSAYTQQIQVERIVRGEKSIVVDINDKTLEKSKRFFLQDADLVKAFSIVDLDENAVYLVGNVKYPGKYAFEPGMRLGNLIRGPDDLEIGAYFDYALIKRENPPAGEIVLIPFNLGKLVLQNDPANNPELTPKDTVYVFNLMYFLDLPYITIEGEVRGDCGFDRELAAAKKIRVETFDLHGRLKAAGEKFDRLDKMDPDEIKFFQKDLETLADDLGKSGKTEIAARLRGIENDLGAGRRDKLQFQDRIREIDESLKGFCRLELFGNMRIKEAVLGAGGLTRDASLDRGEIIRKDARKKFTTIYFNLAKAMAEDPRENLLLQEDDSIIIHSVWESVPKKTVFIDGDVNNPGSYQFTEKMTVRDLVFKAGNVLESAYLDEAEIASMEIEAGKTVRFVQQRINLGKALNGDPVNNVPLKPYDRLLVRKISNFQEVRFAEITGEVAFPAKYQLMKGEKLSSLIERAGGYLETAYLRGAYFTRERVREAQQKSLVDMADRVERELLTGADISTALSAEELAGKKAEVEQKRQFVRYLRGLKATGRMTIKLAHLRLLKGSEYDIELENGDRLFIPEKNNVVTVTGAVMSQGSYLYSSNLGHRDYIDMTGGLSRQADEGNIFVLKVDGSAWRTKSGLFNWNSSRNRWEVAGFGENVREIEPGDTIIVPERIEKIAWLREIRDITQILMNTAVTAGVFKALY